MSATDLFSHFKEVFSQEGKPDDEKMESFISNFKDGNTNVLYLEQIDAPISLGEVIFAINNLKRIKGAGLDGFISEVFIDARNKISPVLVRIFNVIFAKGIYPKPWSKGRIVPVLKKGDEKNPDNYRGITISIVSLVNCFQMC